MGPPRLRDKYIKTNLKQDKNADMSFALRRGKYFPLNIRYSFLQMLCREVNVTERKVIKCNNLQFFL